MVGTFELNLGGQKLPRNCSLCWEPSPQRGAGEKNNEEANWQQTNKHVYQGAVRVEQPFQMTVSRGCIGYYRSFLATKSVGHPGIHHPGLHEHHPETTLLIRPRGQYFHYQWLTIWTMLSKINISNNNIYYDYQHNKHFDHQARGPGGDCSGSWPLLSVLCDGQLLLIYLNLSFSPYLPQCSVLISLSLLDPLSHRSLDI